MILRRVAAIALILAAFSGVVNAQDNLSGELVKRAGQNIDLTKDPALKAKLVAAGLASKDATVFHVGSAELEKAFAEARFENHVNGTRYHVGDRIMVEDKGSGGRYSPRAEITGVNQDGTYTVKLWDKAEPVGTPSVGWGHVDALTGELSGARPIKVTVHNPDGTTREETSRTPWLVQDNVREVTMTQDQVDKLNGRVENKGAPYSVNGWSIDPKTDPVLAESIAKANAAIDRIFPPGTLTLPTDPAARAKKLEELTKLQEKFLTEVFNENFIEHPGNNPRANDRMRDYVKDHPDMRGKVGAVIASACGVCTDQAAAMVAILNEVGSRIGLTARAISGPTIKEGAGHGFVALRFVDGKMGMYDVTWHFQGDRAPVDNMDFATWAGISNSNRTITSINEATTDPTKFVDPKSDAGRALYRGYTNEGAEALLAVKTAEHANANGVPIDHAADHVVGNNTGGDKLAGNLDLASIIAKARGYEKPAAGATSLALDAPRSRGFLSRLIPDALRDRIADNVGTDRVLDRGR